MRTVLAVDDYPGMECTYNVILKKFKEVNGFDFFTDRVEAYCSLLANPDKFCAVFTNYGQKYAVSPEMNGLQLIEKIRKFDSIPMVLVSGSQENLSEIVESRGGLYIPKPFDFQDFKNIVFPEIINYQVSKEYGALSGLQFPDA
jgi:DNA-binding NtrC family response regulator